MPNLRMVTEDAKCCICYITIHANGGCQYNLALEVEIFIRELYKLFSAHNEMQLILPK